MPYAERPGIGVHCVAMEGTNVLTPQQVSFYETFGYLRLPGLFRD